MASAESGGRAGWKWGKVRECCLTSPPVFPLNKGVNPSTTAVNAGTCRGNLGRHGNVAKHSTGIKPCLPVQELFNGRIQRTEVKASSCLRATPEATESSCRVSLTGGSSVYQATVIVCQ